MAKKAPSNKKHKKVTQIKKNKQKRKQTARDAVKNPGLEKRYFSKIKQEVHEIDYAHKLSEKDKAFLSSFNEETIGSRFNHNGKKHYKSKRAKKEIYTENNARNRDQFSISRATGTMVDIDPEVAISIWQEKYVNFDFEEQMLKEPDEAEILTERQYRRLVEDGASIPEEMRLFYEKLFKKS